MDVLSTLRTNHNLQREDVDLFIVYDGNRFESPWHGDDGPKLGCLKNFFDLESERYVYSYRWQRLTDTEATYISTRIFGDTKRSRAVRVRPIVSDLL